MQADITSDLSHEAEVSFSVIFILKLSDPDVKYIWLASAVEVVELETLGVTLPVDSHPLGLQPGWVSLRTWCCASMHEVTCTLT